MQFLVAIGVIVATIALIRIWTGALNVKAVEQESLSTIERSQPYLPKFGAILFSVVIATILFILSLRYGKNTSLQSLTGSSAVIRTVIIFAGISAFGLFDQLRWHGSSDRYKYFYAFVLGTIVTWVLIAFKRSFFETGVGQDPFLMALGVTCIVIGWRFLFGPWTASIKCTVLGTFILWVSYAILRYESKDQLLATVIATVVALIPVGIWCWLFLRYHRQRLSIVLLAFFAGMLSTVPILFYNQLILRGIELNFFLFRIVPESFGSSSKDFVTQSIFSGATGTTSVILTTLVTYLVVGVIEEGAKYWVLRHSSKDFFRSIDDVLQLAIIVALGFAFAENLANPTYFVGFVQQYLLRPVSPMWGPFLGAVIGRGVLTTMVHVLSTGVLGYFAGLAFFASPVIRDQFSRGKHHPIIESIHRLLSLKTEHIYAQTMLLIGVTCAILIHGFFDFSVSITDVIPGNPTTLGQLFGSSPGSPLQGIAITLLPSVLYIVGGFWLLAWLFERTENMKEYGYIVETQAVIS